MSAKAIKEVLKRFSDSSGFFAALMLYPQNSNPVPTAAPDKVIEVSPRAINFEADIATTPVLYQNFIEYYRFYIRLKFIFYFNLLIH